MLWHMRQCVRTVLVSSLERFGRDRRAVFVRGEIPAFPWALALVGRFIVIAIMAILVMFLPAFPHKVV